MPEFNPYESPLAVAETAVQEQDRTIRGKRPVGVSILAVLHLLLGLLLVLVLVLLGIVAVQFGLPPTQTTEIVVGLAFIGLAMIVFTGSAVGLWLGTPWGWWLASFTHAWSIVASISTIFLAFALQPARGEFGLPAIFMHAFYAVLSGLALGYLFRTNVRRYCAADSRSTSGVLATLFGAAIVLVGVTTLGTWLAINRA